MLPTKPMELRLGLPIARRAEAHSLRFWIAFRPPTLKERPRLLDLLPPLNKTRASLTIWARQDRHQRPSMPLCFSQNAVIWIKVFCLGWPLKMSGMPSRDGKAGT